MNNARDHGGARSFNFGALLTTSAIAAAVFVVLALVAFTRPTGKPTTVTTPYTQQVPFGYSAHAPAGPVYPTGAIHTGDPIFLSLVHQVGVHVDYTFATAAAHDVAGTEAIRLRLTAQSGWSRTIVLTPPTQFTGDHTSTEVTLDIPQMRVSAREGRGPRRACRVTSGYTTRGPSCSARHRHGRGPSAQHELRPVAELRARPSAAGVKRCFGHLGKLVGRRRLRLAAGRRAASLRARTGPWGRPRTAPATITVLGVSPTISLLRWIAVLGLLLSGPLAVYAFLRKRGEPFEESVQIQAQYGHLIVPIVAGEDLGWPPVDVPNIKALVRLAESGQRLILHNRSGDVDTYMVNDEGTVYRYQVKASKIVWGEWTDDPVPVEVAASGPQAGTNVAPGAANAA